MKKSLTHLPQHKREELKLVTRIIRKQFPSAHMIILFGSYARNEWVEDIYTEGHITYEYISDFDILVTVKSRSLADNHDLDKLRKMAGQHDPAFFKPVFPR